MNSILQEQEFQASGCTENECAVQIGKLLSTRKILVGTVNQLGATININARMESRTACLTCSSETVAPVSAALDRPSQNARKLRPQFIGEVPVDLICRNRDIEGN